MTDPTAADLWRAVRRAVRRYAADHGMGFETAMLMSVAALDGWLEAEMARERAEQDSAREAVEVGQEEQDAGDGPNGA